MKQIQETLKSRAREILYKEKDQGAWKQLWRSSEGQSKDTLQYFTIQQTSVLLSCLPIGFSTITHNSA